ncbi:ATP-dependent RNA helicase HrpA [Thiomicrorhabdus arctica]|uniref:ATP-dependent RNA helicase HrpA n=1 Tax=Thiomicrorhabdus arctica TaxID=131540 RepID=UPI00035DFF74|nr:ATP-dependent RNA helicase HrpA [Thiomicrorhabdus arctica]
MSEVSFTVQKNELSNLLDSCLIKDRSRLQNALNRLDLKTLKETDQAWLNWANQVQSSIQQVEKRRNSVPKIEYDDSLPVAAKKEELVKLIRDHQVVVIAGETGSGKTTQIPKICLEAGLGVRGRIGCTQPRRLAARSVSERIAEELGGQLGDIVGYQVRFLDLVKTHSLIKVMTDGILLAEIQNDQMLLQYDTIIIDEAHERSINIDFLLGILKQLLLKRPDFKVIITSATIDTQRFADHFTLNGKRPPVVEVSGRTYPVELRYRPLSSYEDDAGNEIEQDMTTGIADAIDELALEDPFGDVLVFQVGERDIKETAEVLRKRNLKNTEVIPLYARLSMTEQQKIFKTSQKRRIILSTNVAETSLTVPGIKYVVDPGLVRISRYSVRNKVQRLPIEKISQASANQRKGRCGRVSAGICIRLYDEASFNSRPEFTDPEIHRTSLSSVILTMAQLSLGDVKQFPFIEAPSDKSVNDGYRQLHELGALDDQRRLTAEGRQIAKLPVDPSVAKMVVEADKNGVLAELIVIASALSIQDPRDINQTTMQAARVAHKPFEDERSDFLFFLNLWQFYEHQRRHLSENKLRKLCKTNFLSYMRMKEWHELTMQIEQSLKRIGLRVGQLHLFEEVTEGNVVRERLSDLHSVAVHKSLLAGLLGNVALRDDDKSYIGARNTKLFIHPSSSLYKRKPKWLLAGELVETTKLYARNNAAIDIQWIESLAKHLIKHNYTDPHWQKKNGQVGAYESITLYGLPIVNRRHCNYGPINPVESHKLFIRHGLVEGELLTRAAFFKHNQALIEKIEKLEHKLRRPDFLVDDEVLYQFYDERIPKHIFSQPALDKWVKKSLREAPEKLEALFLTENDLMKQETNADFLKEYPDQIQLSNQLNFAVDYHFEPGKKRDGLIYHVPLSSLNLLQESDFEWLTPGLLKEKTSFYIKALPKQLRKQFIPAPHYAALVLSEMSPEKTVKSGRKESYLNQLIWALNRRGNLKVSDSDFEAIALPDHLLPFFVLEDDKGKVIAEDASLSHLKSQYQHLVDAKIQQHQSRKKQSSTLVTEWNFGDLESSQTIKSHGVEMVAYPALQYQDEKLSLELMGDEVEALEAHAEAVLFLIRTELADKLRYLQKKLPLQKACLCYAPYGTCQDLTQQVIDRALQQLVPYPETVRRQADYKATLENVRLHWIESAQAVAVQVNAIFIQHQVIAKRVRGRVNPRWLASITDIQQQLDALISKDFVRNTPEEWFKQISRYLKGLEVRLEKIEQDPSKDQLSIRQIQPVLKAYQALAQESAYQDLPGLVEIRWLIEELRLSLFAQPMKTLMPISVPRIEKRIKAL